MVYRDGNHVNNIAVTACRCCSKRPTRYLSLEFNPALVNTVAPLHRFLITNGLATLTL